MDNSFNSSAVRRLVYSIVQFLRAQLERTNATDAGLSEEGVESVEVALQCLETAYGISSDNTHLNVSKSLYDIFYQAVKDEIPQNEPLSSTSFAATSEVPQKEATEEEKAEAELLKNEGNQLMREEKYAEALECYTKAIGKDGSNAVYFCNRAAAHSKLGNHSAAIDDCQSALVIAPNYSKAYGRMGLAYSSLNNHSKAKECYEEALKLEPDNESYRANLSVAEEKLRSEPQNPVNPFAGLGRGMPFGGLGGLAGLGGSGPPDLSGLLSNPTLMNMATQLMSDPNMQNIMTNILGNMGTTSGGVGGGGGGSGSVVGSGGGSGVVGGGGGGAPMVNSIPSTVPPPNPAAGGSNTGIEALLTAGRQLAEQMQTQHPELVEQLRSQRTRGDGTDGSNAGDPPSQS